ncbi:MULTISPECIES: uracil-DNA glycosylase [unclassified Methylomonas]|uniref:uracil-DNA glycosylase n=1 Tax=unclassified Methylomonas TaxID=2608980 RepID=UPI0009F61E8E|nr:MULTISPECIES: uracil-DNA glycosylase [unclassified Methylomonas]MDT4329137.1 uracil-DNA glycosylase [Methylomonas sp. MV1]
MDAKTFVSELANICLEGVFNPYANHCEIYDLPDAASVRKNNLIDYLNSVERSNTDTIWMGRDLGHRGGRRTGLALTDESHFCCVTSCYPGSTPKRATKGPEFVERTATEIWNVIKILEIPPLLWNVFPFHPHLPEHPLTNRRFTTRELKCVDELNRELIAWLGISRIITIGQDAAKYASTLGVSVETVRHPSYGGIKEFRAGINKLYQLEIKEEACPFQGSLFET